LVTRAIRHCSVPALHKIPAKFSKVWVYLKRHCKGTQPRKAFNYKTLLNPTMQKTLKYLGLIVLFTISGFLFYNYYIKLSAALTAEYNLKMVMRNLNEQFVSQVTFALVIGILPILYLCVEKLTKIKFVFQGLVASAVIVTSGITLWLLKIYMLDNELSKIASYNLENQIEISFFKQTAQLNLFLLSGFILGSVVSFLIFKRSIKTIHR